ncbi:hypothetical protein SETIT_4G111100v2 [Setaria italica]|uniref:Uncharacterized protein n=1 Tax=Setaria italica TaxID=4555 RepID=A0A368QTL2_SETIT|nr:hypothetical protein SETIT_4G111100v2 [Setaria italica]
MIFEGSLPLQYCAKSAPLRRRKPLRAKCSTKCQTYRTRHAVTYGTEDRGAHMTHVRVYGEHWWTHEAHCARIFLHPPWHMLSDVISFPADICCSAQWCDHHTGALQECAQHNMDYVMCIHDHELHARRNYELADEGHGVPLS